MAFVARLALGIMFVAAGNVACGDDSGTAPDDVGTRDDAREAADDGPTETVPDQVEEGDGPVGGSVGVLVVTSAWPGGGIGPASGAAVAFDGPDGVRIDAVTGATGRATFVVADWSAGDGTAAVTAYLDGHVMVSRVGITAEDAADDIEIDLPRAGDPEGLIAVSGRAAGMDSETSALVVSATVPNLASFGEGPEWAIDVVPGAPFSIVACERRGAPPPSPRGLALEVLGWTVLEHAAVSAPTTASIDFSAAATPVVVNGSFALPSRADSPLRRNSYGFFIATSESSDMTAYLGFPTLVDVAGGGGSFQYTGQYVRPDGVSDPATIYIVVRGSAMRSMAVVDGWPADGANDPALLDVPTMTAPAGTARHPLHDPISWDLHDAGVDVAVSVIRNEETVWSVRAPRDAETATVPRPPSSIDADALLGTGLLEGRVGIWREDPTGERVERSARTDNFVLTR
ncbi:MAG: hypothetical protein QME96_05995 [Myxococcota bacterium]|nr:hypothetical protein [Myxococcota bacterium]